MKHPNVKVLKSDLQYFSCVEWYKTLIDFPYIYFDLYEQYRKMSFRNRCIITGANGLIQLTVPLKDGRNQRTAVNEVLINNATNWQIIHWRSIVSSYSRSPWFEHYADSLKSIYEQRFDRLADWNLSLFTWVVNRLDLDITMVESPDQISTSEVLDIRDKWLPKNYQSPQVIAGSPVIYHQVFEERFTFYPNLSIIDLLFCEGARSRDLLKMGGEK